jgi:hypothetical protein
VRLLLSALPTDPSSFAKIALLRVSNVNNIKLMLSLGRRLLGVVIVVLLAFFGPAKAVDFSLDECLDLGFQPDVAQCSDCGVLLEHLNDGELHRECQRCCTTAADNSATAVKIEKYISARLELDYRLVTPGSEWKKFFEDDLPKLQRVVPMDTPRSAARLVMESADGEKHPIRISTWSTDLVREYLRNKLESSPP